MSEKTKTALRYRVEGMDCASCVTKVETALGRLSGLSDIRANAAAQTLVFAAESAERRSDAENSIKALGYGLRPLGGTSGNASSRYKEETPWWKSRKATLSLACAAALAAAFIAGRVFPQTERIAFLLALAVGLLPIASRALSAARAGIPFSIETLMTIAAVGATLIGATEEAATVVMLFLVGELLEGVAASRARANIRDLAGLVPKRALLEQEGETREVPAESLETGAVIVVRPGDRIAADGEIIEGQSAIDEAPVTGESVPKSKGPGASVFAGTINSDGRLRVRVTAAAADNTIARVVRLVEEAQEAKAPTERLIDRFAKYYTPLVIVIAALVAIVPPLLLNGDWLLWVYKGLAILLIGCPCALVISTPAAIAAGLSAGARRGLLVKGGAALETAGKVTLAALDKTGTLTEGKPRVTDIIPFARDERQVLSLAAALEASSNHPLALAITEHAKSARAPIPPAGEARALAGKGVEGKVGGENLFLGSPQAAESMAGNFSPDQKERIKELNAAGKTVSVLIAGGAVAGLIAMRDEPRSDAREGIQALRDAGIEPFMLTGDNKATADAIARTLGIDVRAELLPEDKQRFVREHQTRGARVAKVGDGINDAPALAAADIGIAMGGGTDVALETADAAVLHGRVLDIARIVNLSRKVMANIRENIVIALGLKAVFLVTTIAGITGLWPAILADTGATVLVTLNALRLLRVKI